MALYRNVSLLHYKDPKCISEWYGVCAVENDVLTLRVGCQTHSVENWLAFAGDMKALWDEVGLDYVYYKSLTEWIVDEIGSRHPESYSKEWEEHLPYLDEETKRLEEYIRNLPEEEDEND